MIGGNQSAIANQSAITQFFAGKGLTAAQIAGIEGNIQVESHGNPAATNPNENAHGIAQWEGGRYSGPNGLLAFARNTGGSAGDLTTQLNFYWQELQTTERGAMTALLAATTPEQAATAIQSKYERSSTASLPTRVAAAQSIFSGGVQGGSGQVSGGGGGATVDAFSLGGLGGALAGGLWGGFADALKPLGRFVVDGFVVVIGTVLVIIALVLLAKSASDGGSSSSSSSTPQAPAPVRTARHEAEHAAEDGGEVAAVAA